MNSNIRTANRLLFALSMLLLIGGITYKASAQKRKYAVIGYVGGYKGLIDTSLVDPHKLTVINYAFVNVKNNRAVLDKPVSDSLNFKYLIGLKKKNPNLKIVISIGGWSWSKNFSDAVYTDTARLAFAVSAVNIVRKYNLDGVDIDWEYPDNIGDGNKFRPDDTHNYTLMFEDIRRSLDTLEQQTHKKVLLSAAVGGFKGFVMHTEMKQVADYLDYVNLMTYDYSQDSLGVAVHHTGLYASKKYNDTQYADNAFRVFRDAGIPAEKLVMGVAFYGHSFETADDNQNGLGSKMVHKIYVGGYTHIKDSLTRKKGYKYYRDRDAKAPYLFNSKTKQFVTFDDEWSVKNKCKYVKENNMGGVMFWEYVEDKKEYLLKEINKDLK